MNLKRKRGAALGLVAGVVVIVVLIGACFFFLARLLGGDRQSMNATDAGALSAARQMLSVSVPESTLAPEFKGLGVNVPNDGNPALPTPSLAAGAPNAYPNGDGMATVGTYNLLAYNRVAGAALLIALNAAEEGTSQAIQNATNIINGTGDHANIGLAQFGTNLNNALIKYGQAGYFLAQSFQNVASENNVNMTARKSKTMLNGNLSFAAVTTGLGGDTGKSDVYFDPQVANNDPVFLANLKLAQDSQGSITSDTKAAYTNSAPFGYYQSNQPFLKAYSNIVVPPSNGGTLPSVNFCALNPISPPHLIDTGRFQSALAQPQPNQSGYAPVNAVQGQTKTLNKYAEKINLTAMACAVVGAVNNEYPVTLRHGYIRISNGGDARDVNVNNNLITYGGTNTNITLANMGLVDFSNGSGNIFNGQLMGSGIWGRIAGNNPNQLPMFGYNFVFHAPDYDGMPGLLDAWYAYDTGTGPYPPDAGWPSPPYPGAVGNANMVDATLYDLTHLTGQWFRCDNLNLTDADTQCSDYTVNIFASYFGSQNSADLIPSTKKITCLEAAKSQVLTMWDKTNPGNPYYWHNFLAAYGTHGNEFHNDSGAKLWNLNTPCAVPSNQPSVVFGTVGTPGALINQIHNNHGLLIFSQPGAPATFKSGMGAMYAAYVQGFLLTNQYLDINSSASWLTYPDLTGPGYITGSGLPYQGPPPKQPLPLAQLYQRCLEICPWTTWQHVAELLQQSPLDLGTHQYIYLPPPPNDQDLVISGSPPPSSTQGLPEFLHPGSTSPDGNPTLIVEPGFAGSYPDGVMFNQVNGEIANGSADGKAQNVQGDGWLHDAPYSCFGGNVTTTDYAVWTPSSGWSNLLGDLSFYNNFTIDGYYFCRN